MSTMESELPTGNCKVFQLHLHPNMHVHRDIDRLPSFRNAVITIGTFDGVHLGHRKIIEQLKSVASSIQGETVIVTFHPHPRKILKEGQSPVPLITTIEERIELLKDAGIDHLVITPFTEAFSKISATDYVEQFLVAKFQPHTVIIGYDHHFGEGRKGNFQLLLQYNQRGIFDLKEIPAHQLDQNLVSSTSIRKAVAAGHIKEANDLLGYPFFFEGKVIHGNKIGRTLGYPTANLSIENEEKLEPGLGIYAVKASILSNNQQQQKPLPLYHGMMSIGIRPTIGGTNKVIEVNLFDFNEDIYGKTMRVFVCDYLRPEVKFSGLEALQKQLDEDKKQSIQRLR